MEDDESSTSPGDQSPAASPPATVATQPVRAPCTCVICFRGIDLMTEDAIWGEPAPGVTRSDAAMHLICYVLRMSTQKPPASTAPPEGMRVKQADVVIEAFADEKCFLCGREIQPRDPLRQYVGCEHHLAHSACVHMISDVSRKCSCPAIGCLRSGSADAIRKKMTAWCKPLSGGYPIVVAKSSVRHEPTPDELERHKHSSILGMVREGVPASVIVKSFESRIGDQKDAKYSSVARRILVDMETSYTTVFGQPNLDLEGDAACTNPCVLRVLKDKQYTADSILIMGFTFQMLASDARNLDYLTDSDFFTARQLARPPLGITFCDLVMAGFSVTKFSALGYSSEDLSILQFSVPAFIAAGGTKAELDAMNIPAQQLAMVFSLTEGVKGQWAPA